MDAEDSIGAMFEETMELASELGYWGTSSVFRECLCTAQDYATKYFGAPRAPKEKGLRVVLLTGEIGSGKTEMAKIIHELSPRKEKKLHCVDLNTLNLNLIESHLFGIGDDVATDVIGRAGEFEKAADSTMFIDEIGQINRVVQKMLLTVISEGIYPRVGEPGDSRQTDAFLIVADNRDLEELVDQGSFLKALYYRLRFLDPITVPSLRDRKEDLEIFVENFLSEFREKYDDCHIESVSRELFDLFRQYDWPGNIRQLKGVLETMCVRVRSPDVSEFGLSHLRDLAPESHIKLLQGKTIASKPCDTSLTLEELEREYMVRLLGECGKYRAWRKELQKRSGLKKGRLGTILTNTVEYLRDTSPEERARFKEMAGTGWKHIDPEQQ